MPKVNKKISSVKCAQCRKDRQKASAHSAQETTVTDMSVQPAVSAGKEVMARLTVSPLCEV